jgi:hypothetical protein
MSDCILKVERLENGFEVEVYDDDTAEKNRKSSGIYTDPYKSYAFNNMEDAVEFIGKTLKMKKSKGSDDEYSESFAKAVKGD